MSANVNICPVCKEPLSEVIEIFGSRAVWKLVDGVYKLFNEPIEVLSYKCNKCNSIISNDLIQDLNMEPIELIQ